MDTPGQARLRKAFIERGEKGFIVIPSPEAPAFYMTRDQRIADLKNDITNWPWTEREDNDDENSDAASSLPVRESV